MGAKAVATACPVRKLITGLFSKLSLSCSMLVVYSLGPSVSMPEVAFSVAQYYFKKLVIFCT